MSSHRVIAAAYSALPDPPPSRLAGAHGKPSTPAGPGGMQATDDTPRTLPLLPAAAREQLQRMQPRPVLAARGQAVAFTPGILHQTTPNFDTVGVRKRLTFSYWPAGAPAFIENAETPAQAVMAAALRARLPQERRHLVDVVEPSKL